MQNGLAILIVISSHLISYKTVATGLYSLMQHWTPWRVIHTCFLPLIAIKNALAVSGSSHLRSYQVRALLSPLDHTMGAERPLRPQYQHQATRDHERTAAGHHVLAKSQMNECANEAQMSLAL